MITTKLLLALAALSFVPTQCIDLDVNNNDSIKSAATTIAKDLVGYYTANLTKPGQAIGLLDAPYYFWETGAMFDTLIQYWRLTGDSQFNDLVIQGLAAQQGTNQDFMPANQTNSEGNDDQSFWALAAMSAAEANLGEASNTSWVTLADAVFNDQAARWDDQSCGGGIRWQIFTFNSGYTYKNSLTNGNFFQLAARLAAYTGNSTYSDWASKAYDWSSTIGLVSTEGAVYDGSQTTSNCSSLNKLQWSSSAGTFIAGSAHMYNITSGSDQWKNTLDTLLISRSGNTSGKVGELIKDAKLSDAEVVVRPCDVSSIEQVDKLVTIDMANMPPPRGVIHAAMVLDDVLFENMTSSQWESVVSAKVNGAWNFHHALASQPLSFFIALSSAAGIIGNRGQAAYAAANTFLNAFVHYRASFNLPASSIDLTAVSDVGYLAENAEKQAQVAENLGSETISEAEVLALIGAAIDGQMAAECNNHCITGLKIGDKLDELFWVNDAKFKHLRDAALAQQSTPNQTSQVSIRDSVKSATSFSVAQSLVCTALMAKVSSVLMVPLEEMDASKPIVVYGLDSLVAIEIRNWITRELEANLQVLELLTSGSMVGLAGTILGRSKVRVWSAEEMTNA